MLRQTKRFLEMHGVNPLLFFASLLKLPRFVKERNRFAKSACADFPLKFSNLMPVLKDYSDSAGILKGHYVHQDLWAAKKIYQANPQRHIDVGSRIDGFITSLLAHRVVEVVDVRPLYSPYENLRFIQGDATRMSAFQDSELESVSCLHAMEHFGLGRYGDPIDPGAHRIFAQSLQRVIKLEGLLYLSVPIGRQKLMFNGHRVFAPQTVLDLFPGFTLNSFSAVDDHGDFVEQANPDDFKDSDFSCGMFEFKKGT